MKNRRIKGIGAAMKNGRIKGTLIGREDHGIPTWWVTLEFDGCVQGIGGYNAMFEPHGFTALIALIDTFGVDSWEKLPGLYCRIDTDGNAMSRITRIGHIFENRWFNLKTGKVETQ